MTKEHKRPVARKRDEMIVIRIVANWLVFLSSPLIMPMLYFTIEIYRGAQIMLGKRDRCELWIALTTGNEFIFNQSVLKEMLSLDD